MTMGGTGVVPPNGFSWAQSNHDSLGDFRGASLQIRRKQWTALLGASLCADGPVSALSGDRRLCAEWARRAKFYGIWDRTPPMRRYALRQSGIGSSYPRLGFRVARQLHQNEFLNLDIHDVAYDPVTGADMCNACHEEAGNCPGSVARLFIPVGMDTWPMMMESLSITPMDMDSRWYGTNAIIRNQSY